MSKHSKSDDPLSLATDKAVSLASREGTFARATGQPVGLNPYLESVADHAGTHLTQYAEGVRCCRAWWHAWDEEESRRRPNDVSRPSRANVGDEWTRPGLPGWGLSRGSAAIARCAVWSGRDCEHPNGAEAIELAHEPD